MTRKCLYFVLPCLLMASCIDDSVTTDSSQQPVFSTRTLTMAPLLNGQDSPTYKFMVYNRGSKGISIQHISVSGNDDNFFRFNVDGHWSDSFSDITIRGGDSIYVFVDARVPVDAVSRTCTVNFVTAGVSSSVSVEAPVIQATVVESAEINADEQWSGNYYLKGDVTVNENSTLTIQPGSNIYFTDGSALIVNGNLTALGEPQAPVVMQGDRFDDIVPDVSYDIVAGQWEGVKAAGAAEINLRHTVIANATDNLRLTGGASATLVNSRVHNSTGTVITVENSTLSALGCEITDAAANVLRASGSTVELTHCTLSNNYIMAYPVEPMIFFENDNSFTAANSVIYGLSAEINDNIEGREIFFRNCLFRSPGTDDDNFINCIWDTDPLLNVVRTDYILDYTPQPGSPVFGVADPTLTPASWTADFYGSPVPSPAAVGAYQAESK